MADEQRVAKVGELADGELRQVAVGETAVLLARVGDRLHAVGAHCPHSGAPLAEGVLCGTRVVCPWHLACFDVTTGDVTEPPALDALPRYHVRVEGDDVLVSIPEDPTVRRVEWLTVRTPAMVAADPAADPRTFAIVGAGPAGHAAAEGLRQEGYRGRIVLLSGEGRRPYDRTFLSKEYLSGEVPAEYVSLRSEELAAAYGIELWPRRVVRCDVATRTLALDDGSSLACDAILLATGAEPDRLEVPGAELDQVLTLRTWDDADRALAAAASAQHAVIAGSGFIGLEAAATLAGRGMKVTVVGRQAEPLARTVGPEVGRALRALLESNGIAFRMGATVARLEGAGAVRAAHLSTGERLDAELVLVAIGVRPATAYVHGVALDPDGAVPVDRHLRVADGVYAAGDLARFPDPRGGAPIRIEHWRLAQQHGRVAARNMAGHATPFSAVPFFWTRLFGLSLQVVGHAPTWESIVVRGELAGPEFLVAYVRAGRVAAAAGCNRNREIAALAELIRLDAVPSPEAFARPELDLPALAAAAAARLTP